MPVTVLVGVQWGDEGKGKVIDVLTEEADLIARFQGGNNAGHTVEIGGDKYVLHLVPSGILRAGKQCVIGNGVVVDPIALNEELVGLEEGGMNDVRDRLAISSRAHLVARYHRVADSSRETAAGKNMIGTTKRGIGPTYADKANRIGVRAELLRHPERLETAFRALVERYNTVFAAQGTETLDPDAEWKALAPAARALAPLVTDTVPLLNEAVADGRRVLCEGAQGMHLDIDFGTYPYVTSSNTTVGGACTGTGLPPRAIDRVVGVVKAYTTRVGEGPFPTELHGAEGESLRAAGNEFGATTGRPRRCGWFDAVACRYAVMVNGVDELAVTKLDVLDHLARLQVCVGYRLDGAPVEHFPSDVAAILRVEPVYEELPGWQTSTTEARSWDDLPTNAQRYLERLSELMGARLGLVSTGPKREQTFRLA